MRSSTNNYFNSVSDSTASTTILNSGSGASIGLAAKTNTTSAYLSTKAQLQTGYSAGAAPRFEEQLLRTSVSFFLVF